MDLNIHIERIMNYHSNLNFFPEFFSNTIKGKKEDPTCEKDENFSLEFIYKTVQC